MDKWDETEREVVLTALEEGRSIDDAWRDYLARGTIESAALSRSASSCGSRDKSPK